MDEMEETNVGTAESPVLVTLARIDDSPAWWDVGVHAPTGQLVWSHPTGFSTRADAREEYTRVVDALSDGGSIAEL